MPYAIFLNNAIIEETEGCLSTLDRGFLYGDGVFETLRAYHKNPLRLEDHITRLTNSAQYFDIPFHYPADQIKEIIQQLLTRNNLDDAYIRMTLSRGAGAHGIIPSGTHSPTFVVHTRPLIPYPASSYETGISLIISSIRRSTACPLSNHKTLNFLENYLIKKEAIEKGAHDALILNTNGHITECAVSNVFIVEKSIVVTPSLKTNILPGITRKIILELCRENGIQSSEEFLEPERVFEADEVFVTNSLLEIMPVSRIDGKPVGTTIPGTVTRFLHNKYKILTGQ